MAGGGVELPELRRRAGFYVFTRKSTNRSAAEAPMPIQSGRQRPTLSDQIIPSSGPAIAPPQTPRKVKSRDPLHAQDAVTLVDEQVRDDKSEEAPHRGRSAPDEQNPAAMDPPRGAVHIRRLCPGVRFSPPGSALRTKSRHNPHVPNQDDRQNDAEHVQKEETILSPGCAHARHIPRFPPNPPAKAPTGAGGAGSNPRALERFPATRRPQLRLEPLGLAR